MNAARQKRWHFAIHANNWASKVITASLSLPLINYFDTFEGQFAVATARAKSTFLRKYLELTLPLFRKAEKACRHRKKVRNTRRRKVKNNPDPLSFFSLSSTYSVSGLVFSRDK
jgi:hypothetical protein